MRHKAVLIRVYIALMSAAQKLLDEHGPAAADPYMTLVGYFSSVRELGGMVRVIEDDVHERVRKMSERGLADRNLHQIKELTSRLSSSEIPKTLSHLDQPFTDRKSVSNTQLNQRRMQKKKGDDK